MFAGAPCWMTTTRDGSSVVSCEQTGARDLTLDDDPVGGVGELLDDPSLVRGRRLEDGVEDDDHDRRAAGDRRGRRCRRRRGRRRGRTRAGRSRCRNPSSTRAASSSDAREPRTHSCDDARATTLSRRLVDAAHDACAPASARARRASDAVKVASPHFVGGNVLTKPTDDRRSPADSPRNRPPRGSYLTS